jgi:peptidoglycan/xylan/chitin deacetylase (PgdA/CDA1 family)
MNRVTLSFDNGPTSGITEGVLEVLARYGVLSTFFVIGQRLEAPRNAALLQAISAAGHWIGNHTWSHSVAFGDRPDAAYAREEIDRAQALIGEFAGQEKLFRPYGNYGLLGRHLFSRSALSYLREQGYTTISWTAVPGDWCLPDWDRDFETRFGDQDWPVVVLHDIENACLARLPDFIARLQDRGLDLRQGFPDSVVVTRKGRFVTLSGALVGDGPPT